MPLQPPTSGLHERQEGDRDAGEKQQHGLHDIRVDDCLQATEDRVGRGDEGEHRDTDSVGELQSSTRQQEATATEHAATASEIAASTNQIAATSANLMNTMKTVNSLTLNAAAAAEDGHSGLVNIDQPMVKM